ncbi:NADH dehydrogenase (quinone) subunit D [Campylobacter geochelonis]|uniref:NADH-quinone oxidoreductase subunit D n=1 Tax=Campylobacter geochelonis TaxID=1780362 RepID=A0A128EDJ2_9BACT|nr:NADH dehydrogenase (quinone) subunit D [Campylobacter geochelonis]QKF70542.1 NADH:quinone oxidoreductase I, chain D [Campylobacter geochelonis]CZE46073.1 NADH dehydrogenase subunit D [Campylobacter geochelonis]CZE46561.1 NADH dehydrogenase subunit D [Campylobacter geochelonis]CZE50416.1 NADH dehydrogenase subunit D [Campylobacter geochelonis]
MQHPTKLKPFFENIEFQKIDSKMILNFGPQHPAAHGQLKLVLEVDGEKITKAMPGIGYMHRGVEKMAENMIYNEFLPVTDRLDYTSASMSNYALCAAVEKLCDIKVPRRAQVIRTIILELNRLAGHLLFLATHALDIGAMTVFLYCFREREYVLDLIEKYCGARLTHNSIKIGGVFVDLPEGWLCELLGFCDKMLSGIKDYEDLLDTNRIWLMRTQDVGVVSKETALSWGCSGVMLRASGVQWDLRKEEPYLIYDELDFDVPYASAGDCYARYKCYVAEMKESVKILRQCAKLYYDTEPKILADAPEFVSASKEQLMTQNYSLMQHFVLVTQGLKPPVGEVYLPTEASKGELGFYIYSTGESRPYRLKIRAPSFWHCGIYEEMIPGHYIADVSAIICSSNILLGEVDR